MRLLRIIGLTIALSIAAQLAVLAIGLMVFGLNMDLWMHWQARQVGFAATVAGIAGAALGVLIPLHTHHAPKHGIGTI